MAAKVTNNAYGTLSAGITNVATTLTLNSGEGARFPALGAGDYFYATLVDTSNNLEIIKVTARSVDSMTIVRGQDGTTAKAYVINDRLELRPTAALFEEKASLEYVNNAITTYFPSGTRLSFQQTSAPTGWTKDTTAALNDSIMRIVTGSASSGGSTAFSTFNGQSSVGATTLSQSQIPSHSHAVLVNNSGTLSKYIAGELFGQSLTGYTANTNPNSGPGTTTTGGGGSHTHSITTNIKYNDFIIATKA